MKKYTGEQFLPIFKDEIAMVLSDLPNGKALAKCFFVDEDDKYSVNQRICRLALKTDELLPKFLYYYIDRNEQLLWYDNGTDQTNLRKDAVLNTKIVIPKIETQHKIVSILDTMEDLVKSIALGLPAEIEARRKQYEYYRNKLLTF